MLLKAQGDAFPYLLMYLMLKICPGLSALGCRIIRSLSPCVFLLRWRHPHFHLTESTPAGKSTFLFSLSLFFLFLSFLANIWRWNSFPGWVWYSPWQPWTLAVYPKSILFLEEASFCSLSWGSFVGKNDCSQCRCSGEEWIWAFLISVCLWQERIPPKHTETIWRVSPQSH